MDPNANLAEQRRITARFNEGLQEDGDAERLSDLVQALDEWMSNGGFPPEAWDIDPPDAS
jgi:hypothetical protein